MCRSEPPTTPLSKESDQGFLFREMKKDLARRRPHYWNDWIDGSRSKILSSSLFMFFTSIAPAMTFAAVLDKATKENGLSQIGPVEVILSTALTGCIFSIFAGQPLCIVGVTGPVSIFTMACFNVTQTFGLEFLPFYCWVQIWSAVMHMLLAATNACTAIDLVSRFSCETFGMLIATIYLVTGTQNLVGYFHERDQAAALLSLLLGLGTAWLGLTLSGARGWSILTQRVRVLIADYAATVAVVLFCIVPYLGSENLTPYGAGGESNATIATLQVPSTFAPTATGRSWLVDPAQCPAWAVAFAIVPAFFLTVLFFFDHNVSSLLCQAPDFGLKKGTAYHWDFFVVGLQILITGLLGIPPVNGLIPQAPLHTSSLCDRVWRTDAKGAKVEVVVRCHEQRLSNLFQALLIGCTLPVITIVGYLPIATLDGLFLYMGIASCGGNSFYERIVFYITDRERRHARQLPYTDMDKTNPNRVPTRVIRRFTFMQLLILASIFAITRMPFVDGFFPFLIAVLVPLRISVLPRMFSAKHVDKLDFSGATHEPAEGEAENPVAKVDPADEPSDSAEEEESENNLREDERLP